MIDAFEERGMNLRDFDLNLLVALDAPLAARMSPTPGTSCISVNPR